MRFKAWVYLSAVLLIGLVALWGCPKKTEVASAPETQKEEVSKPAEPAAPPAAAEKPAAEAPSEVKAEETKERAAAASEGLIAIYFDFDKAFIRDDARDVMKANAAWLKAHPKAKIRIEGNCDERGTKEYNQALGQRRASSAKKYLTTMGISSHRISLISYGKEKPVCSDQDDSCWQKNRRDDFIVVTE